MIMQKFYNSVEEDDYPLVFRITGSLPSNRVISDKISLFWRF